MKIPSGTTDQFVYFVAVDDTDFTTRETSLSADFTVYRSRNGAAAAAMTTPTVNEVDSTNMPGVYELLLDEDMTIGAGNDTEEMVFHIEHPSGVAPISRTIELYRAKITVGETVGVSSGAVSNVTLVATTTTNTDVRGTDSALLAANVPTNFSDLSITASTGRVDLAAWLGTAVTVSSTSAKPEVDLFSVSDDATAADNLELMYDGTGYTDPTAPASRAQADGLGAGSGGSVNIQATEDNTGGAIDPSSAAFVGSVQSGTFASTEAEDGVLHDIDDTGNDIDIVYGFSVGGGRTATAMTFAGFVQGNSAEIKIKVYDHVGADWEIISTIPGSNGITNVVLEAPLLLKHTGTGAELSKVYIRFETDSTSPSNLSVDALIASAVSIGQSVGYANGSVWIDTNNGVAGTEAFVNGVADNPVDLLASAKTISTSVGIGDFHIINGSTITLAENTANESYFGDNWILALGGQTVTGAHFQGASVSGVQVGACEFHECEIGTITTIDGSVINESRLQGTITLPTGDIYISNSEHAGTPILDFGAAVGNTTVHMHKYGGGIELFNLGDSGTDVLHLDGQGKLTINANSSGGTVNLRGNWQIVNNASGVTINYDDQSEGYVTGAIWIDTNNGVAGTNSHINGTAQNPVDTIADAVTLKGTTGIPDFHLFNGSSITLAASAANNSFFGDHWTLALGGQACGGIYVQGATVSGVGTSAGEEMHFEGCDIGTATVEQGHFDKCGFFGTLTMNTADDYESTVVMIRVLL